MAGAVTEWNLSNGAAVGMKRDLLGFHNIMTGANGTIKSPTSHQSHADDSAQNVQGRYGRILLPYIRTWPGLGNRKALRHP